MLEDTKFLLRRLIVNVKFGWVVVLMNVLSDVHVHQDTKSRKEKHVLIVRD